MRFCGAGRLQFLEEGQRVGIVPPVERLQRLLDGGGDLLAGTSVFLGVHGRSRFLESLAEQSEDGALGLDGLPRGKILRRRPGRPRSAARREEHDPSEPASQSTMHARSSWAGNPVRGGR